MLSRCTKRCLVVLVAVAFVSFASTARLSLLNTFYICRHNGAQLVVRTSEDTASEYVYLSTNLHGSLILKSVFAMQQTLDLGEFSRPKFLANAADQHVESD
jgi:hypothetical protein